MLLNYEYSYKLLQEPYTDCTFTSLLRDAKKNVYALLNLRKECSVSWSEIFLIKIGIESDALISFQAEVN